VAKVEAAAMAEDAAEEEAVVWVEATTTTSAWSNSTISSRMTMVEIFTPMLIERRIL
jgi:hypothetical protein